MKTPLAVVEAKSLIMQVIADLEKDPKKKLLTIAKKDPKWFHQTYGRLLIPKAIDVQGHIGISQHERALDELE